MFENLIPISSKAKQNIGVEWRIILLARRAEQGLPSANSGNKGGAEEGGDTNSYEQSNLKQQQKKGKSTRQRQRRQQQQRRQ